MTTHAPTTARAPAPVPAPALGPAAGWRKSLGEVAARVARNRLALAGAIVIAVIILLAIAAPWVAPYDPLAMDSDAALAAPRADHWLGTDKFGRDLLSRIIYGARLSLWVGIVSVSLSLTAGSAIGLAAGYFGGWIDSALSRFVDTLLSFPDVLLALAIMAILGASTTNVMLAIGIVYTPIFARIARGATLQVKASAFVEAARALGISHTRILLRHVLPNIASPLIVQTTLSLAFAILAEAALSFLGLGVEPDAPSWGVMLAEGKDWMELAWWIAVFPGIAITLAVLSFNLLGDGLSEALDPRHRDR
jgi:peptide/nickel transport system permease protein